MCFCVLLPSLYFETNTPVPLIVVFVAPAHQLHEGISLLQQHVIMELIFGTHVGPLSLDSCSPYQLRPVSLFCLVCVEALYGQIGSITLLLRALLSSVPHTLWVLHCDVIGGGLWRAVECCTLVSCVVWFDIRFLNMRIVCWRPTRSTQT